MLRKIKKLKRLCTGNSDFEVNREVLGTKFVFCNETLSI